MCLCHCVLACVALWCSVDFVAGATYLQRSVLCLFAWQVTFSDVIAVPLGFAEINCYNFCSDVGFPGKCHPFCISIRAKNLLFLACSSFRGVFGDVVFVPLLRRTGRETCHFW